MQQQSMSSKQQEYSMFVLRMQALLHYTPIHTGMTGPNFMFGRWGPVCVLCDLPADATYVLLTCSLRTMVNGHVITTRQQLSSYELNIVLHSNVLVSSNHNLSPCTFAWFRAAHEWAASATAQEPLLGVEILRTATLEEVILTVTVSPSPPPPPSPPPFLAPTLYSLGQHKPWHWLDLLFLQFCW